MNRRTFIKTISAVFAAPLAFLFAPKKKLGWKSSHHTRILNDDAVFVPCREPFESVDNWGDENHIEFPEPVIEAEVINDRTVVFCQDSIWELEFDGKGKFEKKRVTA